MAMNMEAQYAKALQIGKTPQGFAILKQAALGQNDDFDQVVANMALKQLTKTKTAVQGQQAAQQLASKQTVAQRNVAAADAALPEMLGIGRLPAPGMEELAAAEGGIMSYADGGEVAHFEEGGRTYGGALMDLIRRQFMPGEYLSEEEKERVRRAYKNPLNVAEGKSFLETPINRPPLNAPAVAPTPTPTQAATPPVEPVKAPAAVKNALATVTQPKAPVENPTKAEVSNLDKTLADTEKLYDFIDKKFGDQLSPIKDQLQRDRDEYKNMKSENVGLALLGAAGALLKPGRTTASAIGEGLSTLGEYGMKFQPQLLAARQGISAGEIGLAQAQAQAARGNFGTAAQLVGQDQTRALQERELAAKEPLYKAQAQYYGAAAGAKTAGAGGTGLTQLKALQSSLQAQLKGLQGKVDPDSKAQAALIQQQLAQISQRLAAGSGIDLATGFVPGGGGQVFRSSLFD